MPGAAFGRAANAWLPLHALPKEEVQAYWAALVSASAPADLVATCCSTHKETPAAMRKSDRTGCRSACLAKELLSISVSSLAPSLCPSGISMWPS